MTKKETIKLFEEKKVRTVWDDETEEWYFSIVDIIGILTDSEDPRNYWKVLKNRLKKEGNETVTNCNQLKMLATDGKMRLTDVATTEHIFRLIQSIPSPKAEPFKLWMAQVAKERLDQMQDPELSTKEISEVIDPDTLDKHMDVAQRGGNIAKVARLKLEEETKQQVVTPLNSKKKLEIKKDNETTSL